MIPVLIYELPECRLSLAEKHVVVCGLASGEMDSIFMSYLGSQAYVQKKWNIIETREAGVE